ncbi:FecR family protein [Pseudomonas syringae]|uniref:FecR family protein n=1 Tax=Pseudomonas syringae TaxID=317 RepID=UPI003F764965
MTDLTYCQPLPPGCLEQATEWLLLLESQPERLEEFNDWLIAAPEHLDAWALVNDAWEALRQQPATTQMQWPKPVASAENRTRSNRRRRWFPYAAAASLAAVAITMTLTLDSSWLADYSTGIAQIREVQLEDGSRLTLAPKSAIDVSFKDGIRHVELLAGEVFFQVSHDASRPFQVDANGVSVRVLGTAFDVSLQESRIKIEVREGAVGVNDGQHPYRLGAGQGLNLDHSTGVATTISIKPEEVASWASGRQFFENATVAQVIYELRRYHRGWIVIADHELADTRVTGLYDLRETQRALQALTEPMGAQVTEYSPLVLVLRNK